MVRQNYMTHHSVVISWLNLKCKRNAGLLKGHRKLTAAQCNQSRNLGQQITASSSDVDRLVSTSVTARLVEFHSDHVTACAEAHKGQAAFMQNTWQCMQRLSCFFYCVQILAQSFVFETCCTYPPCIQQPNYILGHNVTLDSDILCPRPVTWWSFFLVVFILLFAKHACMQRLQK